MCGQDVSDSIRAAAAPLQFTVAKSYDTFGPDGPLLVTPDELATATRSGSAAVSRAS
jgi:2-keto-4-pentenoate hydratase/2-oxohepta-3-ene-1,7-dioic acid hydratase in catechol pathway